MISFAFLLCSTLLLSSAAIAEVPVDTTKEPLSTEITKASAVAAIEVVNDMIDGKDLKQSMVDRSIEALGKIDNPVASAGKSIMKRMKEVLEGKPVSDVVANTYKAIARKFAGKNKTVDAITKEVGDENMQKFVKGIAKVIEDNIKAALKKRQERNLV